MNNRVGMVLLGIVAAIAVIFAVIQSGNLTQSETKLAAAQSTAVAQQSVFEGQGTAAVATLSAASTQAADSQQVVLTEAAQAAATDQAGALADAAQIASTTQSQVLGAANQDAATAQAKALEDAADAAATMQAAVVSNAQQADATAQANAISTIQAEATATLGMVMNTAATAQAAVLADAANTQKQLAMTQAALENQLSEANDTLATAQAVVVTPVEATAAPTDSVSDVPKGWKQFTGRGVSLQLPQSFVGTDFGSDPKDLGKMLRSLGPDFESAAALFENNPDLLAFIAVNAGGVNGELSASVIVVSVPLPVAIPANTLLAATIAQLPEGFKVLEQDVVQLGDYEAGRLIIEIDLASIASTQLQYHIMVNKTLYIFGFTAKTEDFKQQLKLFEQSMKTFEFLAKPGV